jgi:hypothetical protein
MADEKKKEEKSPPERVFINLSNIDQAFMDKGGDTKIVPPGALMLASSFNEGHLNSVPYISEFKGDRTGKKLVK